MAMIGLDEEGRRRSAVERQKREKDEERARDAKVKAALAEILIEGFRAAAKKRAEAEAKAAWPSQSPFSL